MRRFDEILLVIGAASLAEDKTTLPDAASILALIESVEKKEGYELASAFRKKNEEQPGVGWSLLSQIFDFRFMAGKLEPFGPMVQMEGRRSMIPADLSDGELDAILGTLHTVACPEFQARAGDLLWLRRKDFKAARMAVAAYIEAGSRLEDPEDWYGKVRTRIAPCPANRREGRSAKVCSCAS